MDFLLPTHKPLLGSYPCTNNPTFHQQSQKQSPLFWHTSPFSDGFPMGFMGWFSYGFRMVFQWFSWVPMVLSCWKLLYPQPHMDSPGSRAPEIFADLLVGAQGEAPVACAAAFHAVHDVGRSWDHEPHPGRHVQNFIFYCWLVVSTPLKNMNQLGLLFQKYGKIKNVPNHQPDWDMSGLTRDNFEN